MKIGDLINVATGERKYLDAREREAFKKAAAFAPPDARTVAMLIFYTGCRIGEALELTPDRLDYDHGRVILRTFKQHRGQKVKPDKFRYVELPETFMAGLESQYKARSRRGTKTGSKPLWPFTIRTAQKYIKAIMTDAGIDGRRATARGLRHSMGVNLALHKTPIHLIADILGHESLSSTRIYMEILGDDRRDVIAAVW
ncbi:site-specific integrase [Lewinella sp. JB7]|uniref:tyrosine-type recombinase/integrase n=1 Tax=Lewinella sp. JB7 TaxID=2962887 RepID=UPI0020C97DCA|nr:site-specific integrase [Lewinella sp. JB7]MCP9237896.1 site-specific integrase [Lewinella sp. JB7]